MALTALTATAPGPARDAVVVRQVMARRAAAPTTRARPVRSHVRRTPEDAKTHILDAAERVFERFMPDEVGLRQVAEEGEISHALITHYFGTYDAMVEAVLDRRVSRVRAAVIEHVASAPKDPGQLGPLPVLVGFARDRLTMRLIIWAVTSGRVRRPGFFPTRVQGLKLIVDAITAALGQEGPVDLDALTREMGAMIRAYLEASVGESPKK